MPEEVKTITVAESPGKTVVVNNQVDGIKKYATAVGLFILSAILHKLKESFGFDPNEPNSWGPFMMQMLSYLSAGAGGLALTSPFDKRGVVLKPDGTIITSPDILDKKREPAP